VAERHTRRPSLLGSFYVYKYSEPDCLLGLDIGTEENSQKLNQSIPSCRPDTLSITGRYSNLMLERNILKPARLPEIYEARRGCITHLRVSKPI
jgi:hypothetical protein